MIGKKQHLLIYLPGKNTRELSFSRISTFLILFFAAFFLLSVIAGSAFIGYRFLSPRHFSSNTIKNRTLLKTVDELRMELSQAEAYLDSMVALNNNIRLYADFPEHDLNIENLGIGGRVQLGATDSSHNELDELDADIQLLSAKVSVELESYRNLYSDIQKYKKRLLNVPAITPLNSDSYYISSYYGYRTDPFTSEQRYHSGIDLAANRGTPVHATGNGKVIYAGYSYGGYGNLIKIDHGYGMVTVYAHLDKIHIKKGDSIERGQRIGAVGSTGRSTGPHLHYEVQKNNQPVNPLKYMWDDKSL